MESESQPLYKGSFKFIQTRLKLNIIGVSLSFKLKPANVVFLYYLSRIPAKCKMKNHIL